MTIAGVPCPGGRLPSGAFQASSRPTRRIDRCAASAVQGDERRDGRRDGRRVGRWTRRGRGVNAWRRRRRRRRRWRRRWWRRRRSGRRGRQRGAVPSAVVDARRMRSDCTAHQRRGRQPDRLDAPRPSQRRRTPASRAADEHEPRRIAWGRRWGGRLTWSRGGGGGLDADAFVTRPKAVLAVKSVLVLIRFGSNDTSYKLAFSVARSDDCGTRYNSKLKLFYSAFGHGVQATTVNSP